MFSMMPRLDDIRTRRRSPRKTPHRASRKPVLVRTRCRIPRRSDPLAESLHAASDYSLYVRGLLLLSRRVRLTRHAAANAKASRVRNATAGFIQNGIRS